MIARTGWTYGTEEPHLLDFMEDEEGGGFVLYHNDLPLGVRLDAADPRRAGPALATMLAMGVHVVLAADDGSGTTELTCLLLSPDRHAVEEAADAFGTSVARMQREGDPDEYFGLLFAWQCPNPRCDGRSHVDALEVAFAQPTDIPWN